MELLKKHTGLYTDFYELTMAQAYFFQGKHEAPAQFDYFFRKLPFKGGYAISAGLGELLNSLEEFRFDEKAIDYLSKQGFRPDFLDYLKDFQFKGSIRSVLEGEVIFPNAPALTLKGGIAEAQLVETIVLNALNYPTLIATKASRISQVAGDRMFIDFGMRRAHGVGALMGSRASIIGGAVATSNVLAGYLYDVPLSGTQAHSWIQSFDSELEAFRQFVEAYPRNAVLLVDTYDTLKSGIPNAITVAREMEEKGESLYGVRLDSGDLAYLSKKTRVLLDQAGFSEVKIIASNQLDEYIIKSLTEQGARIDGFGIGTRLITGMPDASLDGVYKLTKSEGKERLKISENIEKITLPGEKSLYRMSDKDGNFIADAIAREEEGEFDTIYHPYLHDKKTQIGNYRRESLLHNVMENGERTDKERSLQEIARYAKDRLSKLPQEHKRFENPHVYRVGITNSLRELRNTLLRKYSK